ncbi:MAG: family 10 glycosylhydrolase [Candidatus Methylacidiphilales bacterium]
MHFLWIPLRVMATAWLIAFATVVVSSTICQGADAASTKAKDKEKAKSAGKSAKKPAKSAHAPANPDAVPVPVPALEGAPVSSTSSGATPAPDPNFSPEVSPRSSPGATPLPAPPDVQPAPPGVVSTAIAHRRELRGAWIATVSNINFPPRAGMSADEQKAALLKQLNALQARHINAVFFQVRPECDALYKSSLEPWSRYLTGTQGKDPGYDPLGFLIAAAHKRNIEVHAWLNPYRAATAPGKQMAASHITNRLASYVRSVPPYLWMDPGATEVQQHTVRVVMDIVRNYDVDGIHFDDYFYPYPRIPGVPIDFPDGSTYNAYRSGGGGLSLGDWRRNNVNSLMSTLSRQIHAAKPWVRFGISPFGISRIGIPKGTTAKLDQYSMIYADPVKWMADGSVDYLAPQLYWRDGGDQSFSLLLAYWRGSGANPRNVPIYPGMAVDRMTEQGWPLEEIQRQLSLARSISPGSTQGHILWNAKGVVSNTKGLGDALDAFYGSAALPPVIRGGGVSPKPPAGVKYWEQKLTWTNPNGGDAVRSWVIYRYTGNPGSGWVVQDIVPGSITKADVPAGTYAVTATDKTNRESAPTVAK